jgi:hypothetical protein
MSKNRDGLIWGLILLAIGVLALIGQFAAFDWLDNLAIFFLAGLGALFLLMGITQREAGWMIPGGILSCIGWGIVAIEGPFNLFSCLDDGGVFMLAFAAGWVLITLLTAVFTDETHWWALIPGGIMALIGATVLWGGAFESTLELLAKLWPLALIIAGLVILWNARREKNA